MRASLSYNFVLEYGERDAVSYQGQGRGLPGYKETVRLSLYEGL
jgi:hypothetical protein